MNWHALLAPGLIILGVLIVIFAIVVVVELREARAAKWGNDQ